MDVFTALAEPTRRSIIEMLAEQGELSATDISDKFSSSPPAISQHLKVLREAKLVRMEKRSRQRIYQINPNAIGEIENWAKRTIEMWDERFNRLDKLLASEKATSSRSKTIKNKKNKYHARSTE